MIIIGITGGICAGKSTVVRLLESLGASIIDADKLGHCAYVRGTTCYDKLVAHFGNKLVGENGEIDRRALGSIVFSDPSAMKDLQNIVWPEIRQAIIRRLDELACQEVKVVVLEAAVMIEAGWHDLVSSLWVVTVPRDVALQRLMVRNNLSEDEASKRINAQISNDERVVHADLVIENNTGSVSELEERVKAVYENALQSAKCSEELQIC